jgi:lipopolysaccharide assembly outer membrane protein LptD (OstA)
MRKFLLSLCLLAALSTARAQFGSFGDFPVEITADGGTRFDEGIAIAENNVQIHYGEYSIFSDYAEYNPDTRDVLLNGNIRIYTPDQVLTGQRALFNLESKQMRALEFSGSEYPFFFRAFNFRAVSPKEFRVRDGSLTTHDSSQPDFHVRPRSIRFYPGDCVVMTNTTLYVGQTPVLWFPFLYADLNRSGFQFLPGYDSRWGAYLLLSYAFPVTEGIDAIVRLEERTEFGPSVGLDLDMKYGPAGRNFGKLRSDYVFETTDVQTVEAPGEPAETRTTNRYRVSFQQRLFLTDDIYGTADVNWISDVDFLEDFYPQDYRTDPQPDTSLSLTKWDEDYTLTLLGRWQINDFQDTTERKPELVFDFKQQSFFGLPLQYDGETGVAQLKRAFSNTPEFGETQFPDYQATRFDTFHQWSLPSQWFGWLNVNPRAGIRGTYYSASGSFIQPAEGEEVFDPVSGELMVINPNNSQTSENPLNSPSSNLDQKGAVFRPIANYGVSVSTKFSRAFEQIQSRALGLDGVRHVVEPYINYSGVYNMGPGPQDIYQFDRVAPSTQLQPLDFPQFYAIDSIGTWNITRMGFNQRFQTRRNGDTYQWLTWNSFMDGNFENPYTDEPVSNLFNVVRFYPLPWASLGVESQMPVVTEGFTELNTSLSVMPTRDTRFSLGHRYIDGNDYFTDNSQLNFFAYWRINDNWSVSLYEQYEFESQVLQYQRYFINRDLTSWVASIGAEVRDNMGGDQEYGFLLMMTLKDAPQINIPMAFSQGPDDGEPAGAVD